MSTPSPSSPHSPTRPDQPTTMRAVVRDRYGDVDELAVRDVALPVLRNDEVLVRVHAAGIDRGAWHVMTGRPTLMRVLGLGFRRPKRPGLGTELSGVVDAVAPGTTGFHPGDEVYGVGRETFAEYAAVPSATLSRKPERLSHVQAAIVPTSGTTALQAVRDHGHVEAGQTVLVIGASGGVGSFAVQIARALGGHVTGVASTSKVDFVRSLGAEHVLDYRAGDITEQGNRYDVVIDVGGSRPFSTLRKLLAPRGTLVFVGGEGGGRVTGDLGRQLWPALISRFSPRRFETFWVAGPNAADLDTLASMIDDGLVTPALDRAWPLADIADAMRALEHGAVRGKLAITGQDGTP